MSKRVREAHNPTMGPGGHVWAPEDEKGLEHGMYLYLLNCEMLTL